jgi:hypothetical protein
MRAGFPKIAYDLVPLAGGLDTSTPTLSLKPGVARDILNMECSVSGGYSRVSGFERFDGRTSPADAVATALQITIGSATSGFWSSGLWAPGFWAPGFWASTVPAAPTAPTSAGFWSPGFWADGLWAPGFWAAVLSSGGGGTVSPPPAGPSFDVTAGAVVTGAESGATGVVIAPVKYVPGSTTQGTLYITKATAEFIPGEVLLIDGTPRALFTDYGYASPTTPLESAMYGHLATLPYRDDIGPVPGSGPVRGVAYFDGSVFAWRDSESGSELRIYRSSPSGWVAVPLGEEIEFVNANDAVQEGDTLTQGGVTATIRRVVVETGSLQSGTNTGRLVLSNRTGGSFSAAGATSTGVGALTLGGAQSAISLTPGGRVQAFVANFGGASATRRIYGCDSVNRAFEFDGAIYTPISSGMPVDAPTNAVAHKNHLFLSFGPSVQFSALGAPYSFSPVFGAGEIALAGNVTCFATQPGDQSSAALAIYTASETAVLYGSDSSTFDLKTFSDGSGAAPYSAQKLSSTYVFDARGVTSLEATMNFGNFATASLSLNIRTWVQARRNLVMASSYSRERSQYRVFFADGSALYTTIANGVFVGSSPVQLGTPVFCITEGESDLGQETSYFGSTDGFVYRLDTGTSFDSRPIDWYALMVWNAVGSPRVIKRFYRASFEVTGESFSTFDFSYELGYGSIEREQGLTMEYDTGVSPSAWDYGGSWDSGILWDGRQISPVEVEMSGSAENVAIRIGGSSAYFGQFTFNSYIMHYAARRGL